MSQTISLPVIPLRDAVVLPGVVTPIRAGRPGTMRAIQAAISDGDRLVLAVLQRDNLDDVDSEALHTIGTIAKIDQVQKVGPALQLLLNGQRRGVVARVEERDGHLEAAVRETAEILPSDPDDPSYQALQKELREQATELAEAAGLPEEIIRKVLDSVDDPSSLADLVTSYLDLGAAEKQELLETLSVEDRLRQVLLHVRRQLSVVTAQADIRSKVEQELGDRQREMLLREQLKAIHDELGDGDDGNDLEELRRQVAKLDLTEEVRKEVDRDFGRLQRLNRESMEYQVLRTYLETVVELPWSERSVEDLDLTLAQTVLHEDHYGLDDVKQRVLEFLAVRRLSATRVDETEIEEGVASEEKTGSSGPSKAPILLFTGPPGVGKTSIAQSIARAMSRKYVRISLGGARDEADIRGHRRTYVGALPGRIIQGMRQAGTKNPVFLLDEIDKLGCRIRETRRALCWRSSIRHRTTPSSITTWGFRSTFRKSCSSRRPISRRAFRLRCWIGWRWSSSRATPSERSWRSLAAISCRVRSKTTRARPDQVTISDEALLRVISGYTREAGVRQLEREIGKLCRKVAHRIATGKGQDRSCRKRMCASSWDDRSCIPRRRLRGPGRCRHRDVLHPGRRRHHVRRGDDDAGKGELVLTGQLGDVMKESGRAAWSLRQIARRGAGNRRGSVRARSAHPRPRRSDPQGWSVGRGDDGDGLDLELSRPTGQHDLAMTGEVTLSGRVLPIGGVKEKVLGAVRSGINRIILPKENEADLEDLASEVRDQLEVYPVEELEEVLGLALAAPVAPPPHREIGTDGRSAAAAH